MLTIRYQYSACGVTVASSHAVAAIDAGVTVVGADVAVVARSTAYRTPGTGSAVQLVSMPAVVANARTADGGGGPDVTHGPEHRAPCR